MQEKLKQRFNIYSHSSVPWQQKIIGNFLESISINKNSRCLDAGCGIGNNLQTLLNFFYNITACDISKTALDYAKKRINNSSINFLLASTDNLPFPDNYFDIIVCTEVVEHINEQNNAIKELLRVLKKDNGYLIISTPNYFNLAGIVKFFIDKILGKEYWNVWGTNTNGIEKLMTWYKLKKLISVKNIKIIKERGGDFLNSWLLFLPFVFRNFKYTDNRPYLWLGKLPLFKKIGMNYFILAKTSSQ